MKLKFFFRDYDSTAFSLYRFFFYISVYIFFYFFPFTPRGFELEQLSAFYSPVSFFKFLSYQDLFFFNFRILQKLWYLSLICAALGLFYPLTAGLSFLIFLWNAGIPLNFGKIHHVNHLLVMVLGIQAMGFLPGRISLDAAIFSKWRRFYPVDKVTAWPIWTIKIYMCLIYCSAGIQKLRQAGLDWIFSDNMATTLLTRPTVTKLGLWVSQFPVICVTLAFFTVFFQLTAPVSLFSKKYASICITSLFFMHIGSYLTMGDHGWFFPYNLCYAAWVPWEKITPLLMRGFKRPST